MKINDLGNCFLRRVWVGADCLANAVLTSETVGGPHNFVKYVKFDVLGAEIHIISDFL